MAVNFVGFYVVYFDIDASNFRGKLLPAPANLLYPEYEGRVSSKQLVLSINIYDATSKNIILNLC